MVKKFTIPFASQGDANDIPDALQVDGRVSFTQGFSYDYERPYDDPQSKDINREDMNGLFKAITAAIGEMQQLGASEYDKSLKYPKGAIVYYNKDLYISQVDDNANTPPQGWTSIKNIADDSLKKAMNLSDLTNKATARKNLGLGSSATLNKTDVLGTSTSLVATQKLVNDTKINIENAKQDKLTFVGNGPEVMRAGAFGIGLDSMKTVSIDEDFYTNLKTGERYFLGPNPTLLPSYGWFLFTVLSRRGSYKQVDALATSLSNGNLYHMMTKEDGTPKWNMVYTTNNTTTDKSGFLRASGSANALTESDRTSSLGTSTTLVASQKLVNDVKTELNTEIGKKITGGSVVQGTGTSIKNVMSQKAVTDAVNSGVGLGLGYNQKWVNVTGQRVVETVYQNTTGKPIAVYIDNGPVAQKYMYVSNTSGGGWIQVGNTSQSAGTSNIFIVPVNAYYKVERFFYWAELR